MVSYRYIAAYNPFSHAHAVHLSDPCLSTRQTPNFFGPSESFVKYSQIGYYCQYKHNYVLNPYLNTYTCTGGLDKI